MSDATTQGEARARVLVVDDLDAHRYVLAHTLRRAGFEVAEAANGEQALAEVARVCPALVLLDVNMPGIDGYEVARRLRQDPDPRRARLPIVHISATSTTPDAQIKGLEGGADGYLVHPVDPEVLVATVRSFLRARRAEEDRDRLLAELATQRRLLESVLDQLPVGVTILEAAGGRVRFANQATRDIWRMEAIPNDTVPELVRYEGYRPDGSRLRPEDWPAVRALSTGEPVAEEEIRIRRRDGTEATTAQAAVAVHDEDGRLVAAVVTIQDVTRRKHLEEYQKYVLGIVGHDLRGPLTAVTVSAETLTRAQDVPPRRKAAAERILTSARRMSRLVSDLLDYSRARLGGGIPVRRESADLAAIAGRVVEESRAAHPNRVVEWRTEGDTHGAFDAQRLEQVASNLLSNALSYGEPGEPVVVSCAGGPDELTLEVTNGGRPIPPQVLESIFEPFHRGDRPAATGSFGLGLYIAAQIVRGHGGSIDVRSGEGQKTTFRVRLPRRRLDDQPERAAGA